MNLRKLRGFNVGALALVFAGAAALAALIKERERMQGRRVGLVLSGQNIDRAWMRDVLAGETPASGA